MKKILPYNLDNGAAAECGNFYKMSIVAAYEQYIPWIMERFIKIQMYEKFAIGYYNIYGIERQTYFDEVLEQREIVDKKDITTTILAAIAEGGYVQLRTDRYFIPGSPEYKTVHHVHPTMVYGFDNVLKEFYAVDVGIANTQWAVHAFSFSVIEEAFYGGLEFMRADFVRAYGPLEVTTGCVFYPKPFGRDIKLKYIYDNLCMLLEGGEFIPAGIKEAEESTLTETSAILARLAHMRRLGITVYRSIYEELYQLLCNGYENEDFFAGAFGVHHGLEILLQNKKGILYRLKYLMDHQWIGLDETLLHSGEKLCTTVDLARNATTKYYYSRNLKLLEQARELFMEAEVYEKEMLEKAKEQVAQSLMNML